MLTGQLGFTSNNDKKILRNFPHTDVLGWKSVVLKKNSFPETLTIFICFDSLSKLSGSVKTFLDKEKRQSSKLLVWFRQSDNSRVRISRTTRSSGTREASVIICPSASHSQFLEFRFRLLSRYYRQCKIVKDTKTKNFISSLFLHLNVFNENDKFDGIIIRNDAMKGKNNFLPLQFFTLLILFRQEKYMRVIQSLKYGRINVTRSR